MKLNTPVCAVSYGNTGFGECYLEPGKIVGAIQVPKDFVITEADMIDLQAFLEAKTLAPIGQRIFIMKDFVALTDNTEDIQIETTDYGNKIPTRDGDYDMTFRYVKGGVSLHQEIQKNRGSGKYFLFFDENGVLYGYKTKEGLKGIPTLFIAQPWRFPTGSTGAQYLLRFIFAPQYINYGNLGYIPVTEFNLFDINGLENVTLTLANLAGAVATVLALTSISGVNMADAFSTNLAQVGAWTAKDEDGNTVTITTVTANPTAEGDQAGWNITFSTIPFNAADKVYLRLAAPATLAAAPINVTGYDTSEPLEIEAPGS